MKRVEIEVKISVLKRELMHWEKILNDKRCGTCYQFVQGACTLAGIAPPPEVQATGCPEWDYDDIPF